MAGDGRSFAPADLTWITETPVMVNTSKVTEGIARRVRGLPAWARWATSPYPPGHYHSPLPDLAAAKVMNESAPQVDSLPGIDLRRDAQLVLLNEFTSYVDDMPFRADASPQLRYHLDCTWFAHGDGVALYSMLRHLSPKRYMEIGSGFSSACALDTSERFLDNAVEFTFVEPNPERLRSLLRDNDQVDIIDSPIPRLEFDMFERLEPGDVLFIDSSHVSKYGSEVNRLFLDIIPRLPAGVHIQVHDIFWPFTYPLRWLKRGRAWNEAYLLRAWLCDNPKARITWFNSYLSAVDFGKVSTLLPAWGVDPGSSIWIETQ